MFSAATFRYSTSLPFDVLFQKEPAVPSYIETERAQAEQWAIRAVMAEEIGIPSLTETYRDLITLCDAKVSILKDLEERGAVFLQTLDKPRPKSKRDTFNDQDDIT